MTTRTAHDPNNDGCECMMCEWLRVRFGTAMRCKWCGMTFDTPRKIAAATEITPHETGRLACMPCWDKDIARMRDQL